MNAYSRTGSLRRIVATVVLPLVALAFIAPASPHEQASDADCQHGAPAGMTLSQGDPSPSGCDHAAGSACAAMVGCVVLPSALAAAAPRFSARAATAVAAPSVNGALHGRLGFGPPTPPPNS